MWTLLLAACFQQSWARVELKSPFPGAEPVGIKTLVDTLPKPKVSPLGRYSFDKLSVGFLAPLSGDRERIRVFGQSVHTNSVVTTASSARFLARLFDFTYNGLKLDHSPEFNNQMVDVYLCDEGQPGGQQQFGEDPYGLEGQGQSVKANMIYVYQVGTLTDRVEACRELAHEYGHAALPPIKITGGREEWANGHLGERVYMRYLSKQLRTGGLSSADCLGATSRDIEGYVARKFSPLVTRIALQGLELKTLKSKNDSAFEGFLALACYAYDVLPLEAFRRSLVLNPDQSASGLYKAVLESVSERKIVNLRKPVSAKGKDWWVPLGTGKLIGGTVLTSKAGWAKVKSTGDVAIKNLTD